MSHEIAYVCIEVYTNTYMEVGGWKEKQRINSMQFTYNCSKSGSIDQPLKKK